MRGKQIGRAYAQKHWNFQRTQDMKAQFEDLHIDGLLNDRCYAVDGPILRIYFKLSRTPPMGWAYLFTQIWHALDYPDKCRAGMEGDAVWIECAPDDVQEKHLWPVEWVVEQTNERYFTQYVQKTTTTDGQRELSRQTHMKLDELAKSLRPEAQRPRSQPGGIRSFLGKILSVPARKEPGNGNGRLTHWNADRFAARAGADN